MLHQGWSALSSLRGDQLCWERERERRCGKVQEIAHSKDKHSLLFSHTFHQAMIMEQILPDVGQWILAMGFQIGDVWGRVSRVQCTWPSGRVVSSAFLHSALQAVKPSAKQTQKKNYFRIWFYQCSRNLQCGFSTITEPECVNRLRRKLLKAHGQCNSTSWRHHPSMCIWDPTCWAQCFELYFLAEGCRSISVERLLRMPPRHRPFACSHLVALRPCGTAAPGHCTNAEPKDSGTLITLSFLIQLCCVVSLQLGFSRMFVSGGKPRKRLQFSLSNNSCLCLLQKIFKCIQNCTFGYVSLPHVWQC